MSAVIVDVCQMFAYVQPWDCSNSQDNLGDQAGRLTQEASKKVAERSEYWLDTDIFETIKAVKEDARESGGWTHDEIAQWDDLDCLVYLVQTVAADLRDYYNADNVELCELRTDSESEAYGGRVYVFKDSANPGQLKAEVYLGV